MRNISGTLAERRLLATEEASLREYALLPLDTMLTTNYSYDFEKAMDPDFRCLSGKHCRYKRITYAETGKGNVKQLHTYYSLYNGSLLVWHIHREAARPDTMVLGHYYYGKLLYKDTEIWSCIDYPV